jgi:hypothetical protein
MEPALCVPDSIAKHRPAASVCAVVSPDGNAAQINGCPRVAQAGICSAWQYSHLKSSNAFSVTIADAIGNWCSFEPFGSLFFHKISKWRFSREALAVNI